MENETMIQKKKSPFLIIIIVAILIMALVICYFSFFSETAIRERKIKNLIASAEKYLDELDYENAIAEYEAVLKLDSKADGLLDDYVDTVLAYAEEVAENNLGEAVDILNDAVNFLNEISDGDEDVEKQAEKLREISDEYQAESDELNTSSESQSDDTPIGETSSDNNSGREDILPYEQDGYIIFGAYEQDRDLANGPEPIEWEILDTNENGTLLVSRYIIDCQFYDDDFNSAIWENCSLRKWLNETFLYEAFSEEEQMIIHSTYIVNSNNPYYGTNGGSNTEDKVFCLSLDEILMYYDMDTYNEEYYDGQSSQLITFATPYAIEKGVFVATYDQYVDEQFNQAITLNDASCWWLRGVGPNDDYCSLALFVTNDGKCGATVYRELDGLINGLAYLDESGQVDFWSTGYIGVRPALYIN